MKKLYYRWQWYRTVKELTNLYQRIADLKRADETYGLGAYGIASLNDRRSRARKLERRLDQLQERM